MPERRSATTPEVIRAQDALLQADVSTRSMIDYVGEAYRDSQVWPFFYAAARAISGHYFGNAIANGELPDRDAGQQAFLDFAYMCRIAREEMRGLKQVNPDNPNIGRLRGARNELLIQAVAAGARAAGAPFLLAVSSAKEDYRRTHISAKSASFDAPFYGVQDNPLTHESTLVQKARLQVTTHLDLDHLEAYDLNNVVILHPTQFFELAGQDLTAAHRAVQEKAANNPTVYDFQDMFKYGSLLDLYVATRPDLGLIEQLRVEQR